ncbi:solute carrier family 22 member 3 isoform X2 [Stigmatopora nigra]
MADFCEILVQIGDFGQFQKRLVLLCSLSIILLSFALASPIFLSKTPDHWCVDPEAKRLFNQCVWTHAQLMEHTVPRSGGYFHRCERFEWNLSRRTCEDLDHPWFFDGTQVVPCNGDWEFDSRYSTIVTEFSLVCGMSWMAGLNQIMLVSGLIISSIITGYMPDRFGRKPCFIGFMFFLGVVGVGIVLSPWYPLVLMFRFLQGFLEKGAWTSCYSLLVEFFTPENRKYVAMMTTSFFVIGMVMLPGLAYLVSSWRTLQIILTLPWFLFIPFYWLIPESPCWLLAQRKNMEALKIMAKVAKENGRSFPQNLKKVIHLQNRSEGHRLSFLDLFKTPFIRRHTVILICIWFSNGVVFHGLVLWLTVPEHHFFEFLVASAVLLPVGIIMYLLVDRVGRRYLLAGTSLIVTIFNFAAHFIFADYTVVKKISKNIGNLAFAVMLVTLFFANAELYPTSLRNLGLSVCSSALEAAVMMSPFLVHWLKGIWHELPFCVYGLLTVVNCSLLTLLPETTGVVIPDTISEIEDQRRKLKQSKEGTVLLI